MADAKTDNNGTKTMLGVLQSDGVTPICIKVNPANNALKVVDGTGFGTSTLIDSYTTFANTIGLPVDEYLAQSFDNTLGQTLNLDICKWNMRWSVSAITGSAIAYLYAMSGTYGSGDNKPTGSPLATSDSFDLANVTSTITYYTFTFSGANKIAIPNANYCIAIKVVSLSGGNLAFGSKNVSPTHQGNKSLSVDGISWTASSGQDLDFYVYGVAQTEFASTSTIAIKDNNGVPVLMGLNYSDMTTLIPIAADINGNLLVKST